MLVEVTDSTLAFDRRTKIPLYAADGVPEVWLVELAHDRYTGPVPGGYRTKRRVERGETVAPTALSDLRLAVDRIIPGRPGGENRRGATP